MKSGFYAQSERYMPMKNTGVMCMVAVRHMGGICHIYMGNYFDHSGQRVLVTRENLAREYGHLVDVPIYVRKFQKENKV